MIRLLPMNFEEEFGGAVDDDDDGDEDEEMQDVGEGGGHGEELWRLERV